MKQLFIAIIILFTSITQVKADSTNVLIYQFDIKEDIGPAAWRKTKNAFDKAKELKADVVLIDMNTFGGMLNMADSIRTLILNAGIKTIVFIDNNAASAGALISIACDKIYMQKGASIGAASVVDGTGTVMPEKYQSYMRSLMRSTAEAKGRDPKIAEGFVDPELDIPGIKPVGKVLTFTTSEAMANGFCDGEAATIADVLAKEGYTNYRIEKQVLSLTDKIIELLINPAVSGILILLILGGLYYELQSPGIGFPIIVSIIAALLYFMPLYLQGLADNWEILLFVVGVILLAVEIFAFPGFGIFGISGIICIVCGLAFSMVQNDFFDFKTTETGGENLVQAFLIVLASVVASIVLALVFGKSIIQSSFFRKISLQDEQRSSEGYVSSVQNFDLTNRKGIAITDLRPSGKIEIDGKRYDAVSDDGFISKDTEVKVIKHETMSLFVVKS